jgi:hypothetical protein
VFCIYVLSVLDDIEINIHKNGCLYDTLEKCWRIADTDNDLNRMERYLIIAWFLDIENKKSEAKDLQKDCLKKIYFLLKKANL